MSYQVQPNPMRRAVYFDSIDQITPGQWPFRNFRPQELASKGNGGLLLDYYAVEMLDAFRDFIGSALHVTSAYRDAAHNHIVGSQPSSLHRQGRAFDIWSPQYEPFELIDLARLFGWPGRGLYETFIHVDDGSPRTWGD